MSKTIYKIEFEFDDNYGNRYQPLSKFLCYEIINNIDDYEKVVDEHGNKVELNGSESFIENLAFCLCKPPFNETVRGYKISKEEICFLPENIEKSMCENI